MVSLANKFWKLKQYKFYPEPLPHKILFLKNKVTENQAIHNLTSFSKYLKFLKRNLKGKGQIYFTSKKYH